MKIRYVTATFAVFVIIVCCNCSCGQQARLPDDFEILKTFQKPFEIKLASSLSSLLSTAAQRFYSRNKKDTSIKDSSMEKLRRYWRQRHVPFKLRIPKKLTRMEKLERYWRQRHVPFKLRIPNKQSTEQNDRNWRQRHEPMKLRSREKAENTESREGKLKQINTIMKSKNKLTDETPPEQILECPLREDGSKVYTCPSEKTICLSENNICDNHPDCPNGEDEQSAVCFYKNWIIQWMLKLQIMIYN